MNFFNFISVTLLIISPAAFADETSPWQASQLLSGKIQMSYDGALKQYNEAFSKKEIERVNDLSTFVHHEQGALLATLIEEHDILYRAASAFPTTTQSIRAYNLLISHSKNIVAGINSISWYVSEGMLAAQDVEAHWLGFESHTTLELPESRMERLHLLEDLKSDLKIEMCAALLVVP